MPVYPLIDRPTPLAERIRNRDGILGGNKGEVENFASVVADTVAIEDDDTRATEAAELTTKFRNALADELDVEPENINSIAEETFGQVLLLSKEDVVDRAKLEELGLADTLEEVQTTNDDVDELLENGENSEDSGEVQDRDDENDSVSFSSDSSSSKELSENEEEQINDGMT